MFYAKCGAKLTIVFHSHKFKGIFCKALHKKGTIIFQLYTKKAGMSEMDMPALATYNKIISSG